MPRQEHKVTRLDVRIPNDVYTTVEEIAKANHEPTHHITGSVVLTPTIIKLIRLGIRSLAESGNYPTLADISTANGYIPDTLTPRVTAIEGELERLKKLVSELTDRLPHSPLKSENSEASDIEPDNLSVADESDVLTDDLTDTEDRALSWTDFHTKIGLHPPKSRSKLNADRAIAKAIELGMSGWKFDVSKKMFELEPHS